MIDQLDGQESLFGADMPSTKTSPALSAATKEPTSKQSSRRSSASSSRKLPTFHFLTKRGGGATAEACMAWEPTVSPFPSDGDCTTLNTGASRKDGSASVCWLTSPDLQRLGFCLTLNLSERPRTANPSRLSEILETSPDSKYALSAKACQGILNRAERRGKELPPELKAALEVQAGIREPSISTDRESESEDDDAGIQQSACKETGLTALIPQVVTAQDGGGGGHTPLTPSTGPQLSVSKNAPVNLGGGKGILIQNERTGALSTLNNQSVFDGR